MTKWMILFDPAEGYVHGVLFDSKQEAEDYRAANYDYRYSVQVIKVKVPEPQQHPVGSFAHFVSLGQ